jgi:hypothetical protein
VGAGLARWARDFDSTLTTNDIIQACRNAWTCCGMQALLGRPMELTPSVLAYSLLYPYSDNHLDHPGLTSADKLQFSDRFRHRLSGCGLSFDNAHERAVWTMIQLIEDEYPRSQFPQVFESLLAIHRAQAESVVQLRNTGSLSRSTANSADNIPGKSLDNSALLRISCAKGGTSALADAVLTCPSLTPEEIEFAFDWGVLLQLGDDLQDVREDMRRGSTTLFTRAIAQGMPLDSLVRQLLYFSRQIADRMDRLPHGTASLKSLLRMSWSSLVLMAVADVGTFCTRAFLDELEPYSSFRFKFLRARNQNLTGRAALYGVLFDAFVEAGSGNCARLPSPGSLFPTHNAQPGCETRASDNSCVGVI